MTKYKVKKILNNNVVIAQHNNSEVILVGKAIGYDFSKKSVIPTERIENVFIKQVEEVGSNYIKLLQTIDSNIIGVSEEIISFCERELNINLSEAIHVSLPDHINFAIRRIEQGVDIENPFLNELKVLYTKEYNLASKALIIINERFNMNLPEDEIGFICLHIRAAITKETVIEPLAYTRKLGEVMELISSSLNKKLPKSSLEYTRTITHLNFMIKRVLSGKSVKNQLLDSVKNTLYNEYEIAKNVSKKIEELFSVIVPEDEIGYIAIHLKRLTEV